MIKNSAHDGIKFQSLVDTQLLNRLEEQGFIDEVKVIEVIRDLQKKQESQLLLLLHPEKNAQIEIETKLNNEPDKNIELKFEKFIQENHDMHLDDLLSEMGNYKIGRPSTYASVIRYLEQLEKEPQDIEQEPKYINHGLAHIKHNGKSRTIVPSSKGIEAYLKIKQKENEWASPFFSLELMSLLESVESQKVKISDALEEIQELLKIDTNKNKINLAFWQDIDNIYSEENT